MRTRRFAVLALHAELHRRLRAGRRRHVDAQAATRVERAADRTRSRRMRRGRVGEAPFGAVEPREPGPRRAQQRLLGARVDLAEQLRKRRQALPAAIAQLRQVRVEHVARGRPAHVDRLRLRQRLARPHAARPLADPLAHLALLALLLLLCAATRSEAGTVLDGRRGPAARPSTSATTTVIRPDRLIHASLRSDADRPTLPAADPARQAAPSPQPERHQGTMPLRSTNVPVGPDASSCAIRTIASVPSSTFCVPVRPLRSVAV